MPDPAVYVHNCIVSADADDDDKYDGDRRGCACVCAKTLAAAAEAQAEEKKGWPHGADKHERLFEHVKFSSPSEKPSGACTSS